MATIIKRKGARGVMFNVKIRKKGYPRTPTCSEPQWKQGGRGSEFDDSNASICSRKNAVSS
ncbi:hypothetical protein [Burkholderia pyrrocinia]|uniref:hypothetical protein n=1 Tax=Burkholderia pyrrocinia TaxID=60550 RepID=UPI002AB0F9A9|nr:hypothetical protein [Burkholderia pyrrocinia]